MVKYNANGVFGIGLTEEDIRALRAGCTCLIKINDELDFHLVYAKRDEDLTKFKVSLTEYPEVVETGTLWI